MIKYDGTKLDLSYLQDAIAATGVSYEDRIAIMDDFRSDPWFNDPKEIHRRIDACGGDSVEFFDTMRLFGVTFDGSVRTMIKIIPNPDAVGHRTGVLRDVTVDQINEALGFEPNVDDDPYKVVNSWAAETAEGVRFAIWDYKGSHKFGQFSTFGPDWIFEELFPKNYTSEQ